MLSAEEFASCWGRADLFPFPADLLQDIDLPDDAKAFLANAGLPIAAAAGLRSILLPRKSLPGVQYRLLEVSPFRASDAKVLTSRLLTAIDDRPFYFAVEEGSGKILIVGSVISSWPTSDIAREFRDPVNSSIFQFAESLLVHREFQTLSNFCNPSFHWHPNDGYYNRYREIDYLEHRFREIDPVAMNAPENWWSSHIAYLRHP